MSESRTPCILLLASICIGESKKRRKPGCTLSGPCRRKERSVSLQAVLRRISLPKPCLAFMFCMHDRSQKGSVYTVHSGAALVQKRNFPWSFAPTLTNLPSKLQENLFLHLRPLNNMMLLYRRFLNVWKNHFFTFPYMGTLTRLFFSAFMFIL